MSPAPSAARPAGAGRLPGVDVACSAEVSGIVAFFEATGVPGRVTSTFRPGAVSKAGKPSRHSRKLAVDFAGPTPGVDSEALAAVFDAFAPLAGDLNELIYAGPQVTRNVKARRWVRKYAEDHHYNHVHVAVDAGVILGGGSRLEAPTTDDIVDDNEEGEEMADPVDAIVSPQGGVWVLTRDGGVRTYDPTKATPFLGSYPALPAEARQGGERTFVDIRPNERGGYDLVSSGGDVYSFPLG